MADDFDYSLFGDLLVKPSTGESADPMEILSDKVIMLFFGAHWWEPCTKFTTKLHLFYQLHNNKEDFEIIFCSMDRSEDDYSAYAEKMPWWCLPYAISTLPKLAAIYNAHGMPHLVVIDKDGRVLTKDGVNCLSQDPVGKNFPWRPQRIVDLLPERYNANKTTLSMQDIDDKYLLLYFSAHSDALSKEFTPWLVKAYNIMKNKRKDFELLFVSGDESEASYNKFISETSFCAIPFEDSAAREALEMRLEITSYPTLVMLGPKPIDDDDNFGDRPVINTEVRAVIENGDYITDFPFYPKPWGDLCKTTDDINTHKCLIVFHEGGDDEEQMDIEDAVRDAAEEYRGDGDDFIKFYWACDPDAPLSSNIRQACQLGPISDVPTMILLDIPNDGTFFVSDAEEITTETIVSFLSNYNECRRGQI
ncbi:redoxin domain protein [Nitzschia inconspicua]|uniref:Redoxin domain protein n=1 Tax=Nitzschia inconspicua TaxID=303405 RepID=A0A9K3LUY5_9STRA|nr:redoxin domain protein [Nitzschia inconspicua]